MFSRETEEIKFYSNVPQSVGQQNAADCIYNIFNTKSNSIADKIFYISLSGLDMSCVCNITKYNSLISKRAMYLSHVVFGHVCTTPQYQQPEKHCCVVYKRITTFYSIVQVIFQHQIYCTVVIIWGRLLGNAFIHSYWSSVMSQTHRNMYN